MIGIALELVFIIVLIFLLGSFMRENQDILRKEIQQNREVMNKYFGDK